MKDHEMTLDIYTTGLWLNCECGYAERIDFSCTLVRLNYLAKAHENDVLIKATERLRVITEESK